METSYHEKITNFYHNSAGKYIRSNFKDYQEYLDFLESQTTREEVIEPNERFFREKRKENPEASTVQIHA